MTAPLFRPLTREELKKLTAEQYTKYLTELIDHIHGQVEDNKKSLQRREEFLKNKDDGKKKRIT